MAGTPPVPPTEPSTDAPELDLLATQRVFGSANRGSVGLDVLLTKVSVDFQNLPRDNTDACVVRNLEALREAAGLDAMFIALYDRDRRVIESVSGATSLYTAFNPEVLRGDPLESLPYLRDRLGHMRIVEIRNTTEPRRELAAEAARFAELKVGSVLMIGFSMQDRVSGFMALGSLRPRDTWDVSLHLMLKLIGTSYATGLDRIRFQDQVTTLQERTDLSLESANDGLWDFDVETNTVYFSPRWKAMLGFSPDDLDVTPDWRQLVHPDDMARTQTLLREHLAGKSPLFESVHRMRHRSGEWRWVVSRAKARVDESGRLKRLVGVELDITERRLYEEALFKEKESAQITLQSIGDGVITTDARSHVEYLNPVAEQLTGWRLDDAQGRPIDEIFRGFHEETCEPLENPLSVAIRRARAIKSVRPTLLIRRDGNELYIESCASPIRDGSGAISGGVLVFHDVSESRELNRKLSYHASHDILTVSSGR
jgi:PAS domain S-box-containing protein